MHKEFGTMRRRNPMTIVCLTCLALTGAVRAQTKPWDVFDDALSAARCDLINAANAELVVLTVSGEVAIISGSDVILEDLFVDADGNVFYLDEPAGLIDFATDADGLRSLWWLAITGEVVSVNGFSGEPTVTSLRPTNFSDLPCDACDFWDDQSVCIVPSEPDPDQPSIIITFCGMDAGMSMAMTAFGLGFMRTRRRWGA